MTGGSFGILIFAECKGAIAPLPYTQSGCSPETLSAVPCRPFRTAFVPSLACLALPCRAFLCRHVSGHVMWPSLAVTLPRPPSSPITHILCTRTSTVRYRGVRYGGIVATWRAFLHPITCGCELAALWQAHHYGT